MSPRPAAEIAIDEALVRGLLSAQWAEMADLPLQLLDRGFDNTNWRLGDELIVRVPHRGAAAALAEHEQRWLPELAAHLPIPIPAPVFAGRPTSSVPWSWSIVPWFEGRQAADAPIEDQQTEAQRLGAFFAALHQPGPPDAPTNPYRGVPLAEPEPTFRTRIAEVRANPGLDVDTSRLVSLFDDALAVPDTAERVWLHGDLHTRNVIVDHGRIAAVIDFGDICTGDRATDLAGAFMLVPEALDVVRARAGADDAAWARARGWAAHFATLYLALAEDDPVQTRIGLELAETLTRI